MYRNLNVPLPTIPLDVLLKNDYSGEVWSLDIRLLKCWPWVWIEAILVCLALWRYEHIGEGALLRGCGSDQATVE